MQIINTLNTIFITVFLIIPVIFYLMYLDRIDVRILV